MHIARGKHCNAKDFQAPMSKLSTHVLDVSTGRPAAGMRLQLRVDEGARIRRRIGRQGGLSQQQRERCKGAEHAKSLREPLESGRAERLAGETR